MTKLKDGKETEGKVLKDNCLFVKLFITNHFCLFVREYIAAVREAQTKTEALDAKYQELKQKINRIKIEFDASVIKREKKELYHYMRY